MNQTEGGTSSIQLDKLANGAAVFTDRPMWANFLRSPGSYSHHEFQLSHALIANVCRVEAQLQQ